MIRVPKRKANLYMKANPVSGDLAKDLKKEQILEQIAWIRGFLTYSHSDPFPAYNSVTALEDLVIAIFESDSFKVRMSVDGGVEGAKHSSYTNPVLKPLMELNEEYSIIISRVRRTGVADFRFVEFLHKKFRVLLRILMSKGIITMDREVIEDV